MAWCIWIWLALHVGGLMMGLYKEAKKDSTVGFVAYLACFIVITALLYFGGAFHAIGLN